VCRIDEGSRDLMQSAIDTVRQDFEEQLEDERTQQRELSELLEKAQAEISMLRRQVREVSGLSVSSSSPHARGRVPSATGLEFPSAPLSLR
jgi:hypothetical protein